MNILYVLNSGIMGGMERQVYDLTVGMVEAGEKVFVWCPDGEMAKMYEGAGAEVSRKSIGSGVDVSYILALKKFSKEKNIDVIHAHELKAVSHALLAGTLAKVKTLVSHTHTPISTWKINKFKRFIDVKINAFLVNLLSTKEIALTISVAKRKEQEGIRSDKICVIPNALSTGYLTVSYAERVKFRDEIRNKYSVSQSDMVFGCLGRITQEKGHEVLIHAFKTFMDTELFHKQSFYLMIAGTGPLEEELKLLVKKLSIEKNVIFTGYFSDEEKVKIYSAFDAFIFPSYTEGFGIVLIEAMYLGLPTIASDIEVLREVGKNTVRYFKPGSSNDLAEEMQKMYKDISTEENFEVDKIVRKAETEYTMSGFINNYLNLYKNSL